jgi:tRNA pseudouridine55 synthase
MSWHNGVLPVDKPEGPTSHDVVARARRSLGLRRIGHTGTLDPFASGLLLLCIGPATRLAEYLTHLPKSYRATLRLGAVTDTDDREGEVVRFSDGWREVTEAALEGALDRQRGAILQVPPRFSAKKVAGERMYDVARRGGVVETAPVSVSISRLQVTRFAPPDVDFEVDCSSGTYIRAIARDVGEALGVGAHLVSLRRTRIGAHSVDGAIAVDRLEDRDAVGSALLSPARAVAHLPRVEVTPREIEILATGGWIPVRSDRSDLGTRSPQQASVGQDWPNVHSRDVKFPNVELPGVPSGGAGADTDRGPAAASVVALVSTAGDLVAIGELDGDRLRPRKVFT